MKTLPLLRAAGLAALVLTAVPALAIEAQHPFMLWTKDEAARLRRQIETEAWAKEGYERACAELNADKRGSGPDAYLLPLFRYGVLGEKAAGEAQKALLLKEVAAGNSTSVANAFRYDVLYDLLSADERDRVRKEFTSAVKARTSWRPSFNRWNWLPNLAYGGYCRLHLLAAATGDEALIREIFNSPIGYKWYLDEYLSDLGFYNEELSKMISAEYILPWAWAMDRLGLSALGWDYRGRQGATMRGHVDSLLRVGLPRVDLGSDFPHYPRLTMGDTRGSFGEEYFAYCFQQGNVPGHLASGPTSWWNDDRGHRMERWLEYLHAKWPDGKYDYFLAAWRAPGQDRYWVSPWFGMKPIDPKTVTPPAAPSGVYPGRGIVMLRAEEGPAYWEAPAPAVGMRLANPYPHHVPDSFCLMGFYAFNRPIFINPGRTTDRYVGVDPTFSGSARSLCTVLVDGQEPHSLLDGVTTRQDFTPPVKFAAARAKGIYAGVDQTRALFLTREYLLDVFALSSDTPHDYHWQVHTFGHVCPDNPANWATSHDLLGIQPDFGHEQSCGGEDTWTVTAMQTTCGAHRQFSGLGERWFQRRVGVRVTMLGEPGTRAYTAWTPVVPNIAGFGKARDRFAYGEEEPARIAIAATRRAAQTAFVAVYEPFEGASRIRQIERLAQSAGLVVLRITGDTYTDYVMLRFGWEAEQPLALQMVKSFVRFAGHGYVRVTAERVDVQGKVAGLTLPAGESKAPWYVRGRQAAAPRTERGFAVWGEAGLPSAGTEAAAPAPAPRVGPLAVRWEPPTELCLPAGGERKVRLRIRNDGQTTVGTTVAPWGSGGLAISPQVLDLRDLAPGAEQETVITIAAGQAPPHRVQRAVTVRMSAEATPLRVQPAQLLVAHGVTSMHEQIGAEFRVSVYAPRYIARIWPMDSIAALELLDPQGFRRNDASGLTYPYFAQSETQADGKTVERAVAPRKHPYFRPILVAGGEGKPDHLYDGGWHVHGFQSELEQWFCEDWMVVRRRLVRPDERIALQWPWMHSRRASVAMGRDEKLAAQLKPGHTFVVNGEGKRVEPEKGLGSLAAMDVRAVFQRPAGYDYAYVTFYLAGARIEKGQVYHRGDSLVGFTFCTEGEFDALLAKWQADPPSGVISDEATSRYRGGGMPDPVQAEP